MSTKKRIVIGLSGGVDSSVSAHLLKQQGHEVVGLFMKNWEDDDQENDQGQSTYCTSRQDWLDAASVADVLGIDIEFVNFAQEYKDRVFSTFLAEYQAGRTPNPDVLCNAEIKFKAFLDHAMALGADTIATGHYAHLIPLPDGNQALYKGHDPLKDQSYFLHRLQAHQLTRSCFPLGEINKPEVRRIAAELGLPNAKKKDSTGICFIGERPFREFLGRYLAQQPGPMIDDMGRRVGTHQGLSFYTLGQRQGLGIGGIKHSKQDAQGEHLPWFVSAKDMQNNMLHVVQGHDHPALLSRQVWVHDLSWTHVPPAEGRYAAKTRYRQQDAFCHLTWEPTPSEHHSGLIRLDFETDQWAVTPGQSAVLYNGEHCLGGGVIVQAK